MEEEERGNRGAPVKVGKMVVDAGGKNGFGKLKEKLKEILDRPNDIKLDEINYIVFGYKISRKGNREIKEIEKYNLQLSENVREEIVSQLKSNIESMLSDDMEFVDLGSIAEDNGLNIQIADLDVIDSDLKTVIKNPVSDILGKPEIVNKLQHAGLLTIINLNNGSKIIGIDTLARKKIAFGNKKMVEINKNGGLDLVKDVTLFYISEKFAAIFYEDKFFIRRTDDFLKVFVLNNYFDSLYQENKQTLSQYIDDPDAFYRKIRGNLKRERMLITLIRYNLRGNVTPQKYKKSFDDYSDLLPGIKFENEKININESNIDSVLDFFLRKYDKDPIEQNKKRRVNPMRYT